MARDRAFTTQQPRGVPRVDDRRVLNGTLWVLRSGAPWRDLPERYVLQPLCAMARSRYLGPNDGRHNSRIRYRHTDDRQHFRSRSSTGRDGKKGDRDHCLGRSRGELTTKIHVVVDGKASQSGSR